MIMNFKVRRDTSSNNIPVVGYNDGVDAQDVILFGACKVTETLTVDDEGVCTLTYQPVSLSGITFTDIEGIRRGRNLNDDIIITSTEKDTTYYAGTVSPTDKTLKIYADSARTVLIDGCSVLVEYYKRAPIKIDENGELVTSRKMSERESTMMKLELSVDSGESINDLIMVLGDNEKDIYITNIIAYYQRDDEMVDDYIPFQFIQTNENEESVEWMIMLMPPKTKPILQIDLGGTGIKIPARGKFSVKINSSEMSNYIHICAFGWQYAN